MADHRFAVLVGERVVEPRIKGRMHAHPPFQGLRSRTTRSMISSSSMDETMHVSREHFGAAQRVGRPYLDHVHKTSGDRNFEPPVANPFFSDMPSKIPARSPTITSFQSVKAARSHASRTHPRSFRGSREPT